MQTLSMALTFKSVADSDNMSEEDDENGGNSTWLSDWKYKRKRNGYKGRTPKHPLNKRPYTC